MSDRKADLIELMTMARFADPQSDAEFVQVLNRGKKVLKLTNAEIAEELNVSRPTITRWLSGKSDPHPAIRPAIFKWLGHQVSAALDQL